MHDSDGHSGWIGATILDGPNVRLEPLALDHAEELMAAAVSPETFRYFSRSPSPWSVDGFRAFFQMLMDEPATVPFCIVERASGVRIGVTTYLDIRPDHRGCEIGWTWLMPSHRGTRTNPEMKRLMLAHAFDDRGAIRVQLKTDLRNLHSQHAIEKLGARKDGVLRENMIMMDGYHRSTVMYSILAAEWPAVRDRLDARLSAIAATTA
jgi:RimJ/RimL family protein N-acetyltransferase